MAIRELYAAREELKGIANEYNRLTGVFRTRQEQAKARYDRAAEAQRRLEQELERLEYALEQAFGVRLGQQSLFPIAREGPKTTFVVKTSEKQLRERIREIRTKLREAPD